MSVGRNNTRYFFKSGCYFEYLFIIACYIVVFFDAEKQQLKCFKKQQANIIKKMSMKQKTIEGRSKIERSIRSKMGN